MDLATAVIIILLLMALISAIVVISAVALGGQARRFEDEAHDDRYRAADEDADDH